MEIICWFLAMICALVAMAFLIAFIIRDIKKAKVYRKATKVYGIIRENCGTERVGFYGRYQYKVYGKYLVEYDSFAGRQTQELLIKDKKLQIGDMVEVRYVMDEDGARLVNDIANARLFRLGIAVVIAVPLCLFWIYMVETGRI